VVSRKKLIEILACIGIVLIVGAIVFPVFAQTKNGKGSPCLRNVKRLANGISIYQADHDGYLPLARNWQDALYPYHRVREVNCDASPTKRYGYALYEPLLGKKAASVKEPQTQMMVLESTALIPNAVGDESLLPNPGRHRGINYIGYLDGRAKAVKSPN
jgi:hypothetical protein